MFYSDEYLAVLQKEHKRSKWGVTGVLFSDHILEECIKTNVNKILDYGSGQGLLKEKLEPKITVTNYDPGIETFKTLPEPHDLVVCFDVLEHIEYDYIDDVLNHIRTLTLKNAMVTIATQPALRILNDGRNAHLIVENHDWWKIKLLKYFNIQEIRNNGIFYLEPLKL